MSTSEPGTAPSTLPGVDRSSQPSASVPPRDFAAVWDGLADVEGWMSEDQGRRLWGTASGLSAPAQIVEIGSFRGRSTIVLATAAAPGVEVVAIDPHGGGDRGPQEITPDAVKGEEDHQQFRANLARAGVLERVRHVRLPSSDALGDVIGGIDLLYIDGAHRYRPASDDIARWGERVVPGGVMLIHDSFNAIGVTLAQLRLLFLSRTWRYVGRAGSLAEYRRVDAGEQGALENALRQAPGLGYFARNMALKVLITVRLGRLTRLLGGDGTWPY